MRGELLRSFNVLQNGVLDHLQYQSQCISLRPGFMRKVYVWSGCKAVASASKRFGSLGMVILLSRSAQLVPLLPRQGKRPCSACAASGDTLRASRLNLLQLLARRVCRRGARVVTSGCLFYVPPIRPVRLAAFQVLRSINSASRSFPAVRSGVVLRCTLCG